MSINPELLLIAKILDTGDMKTPLDRGIDANHFVDDTCAEHFSYLVEYYLSPEHPRSVPSREIFQDRFPQDFIPAVDVKTDIKEWISAARTKQHSLACRQISDELSIAAESEDPLDALERARTMAGDVVGRSKVVTDIRLAAYTEKILDNYDGAKGGLMRGIPWPWDRLNKLTQGIEKGNLILLYGRPKQQKSWVAAYIGSHFYQRNNRGGKVLLISMEMPLELEARRTAALLTQVDYEKFTQGKLNREEEEAMREYLGELKQLEAADLCEGRKKEFIITYPEEDMSVVGVESKIETHQPDLVIVDGIYLLSDARTKKSGVDWKILSHVSRDLKQLAQRRNVPIIGVHQANRKRDADADDLDDIAFADNFARDADVLIKCIKIENTNHGTMIALLFSGAREFKISGFYIHGSPANDFSYIRDFDSKEDLLTFIANSKKGRQKEVPTNFPKVRGIMDRHNKRFGKKDSELN